MMTPTGTSPEIDTLLELVYSVKSLAQSLDAVHGDLRRQNDNLTHDFDRMRETLQQISSDIQTLPILTSERVEHLIDKRGEIIKEMKSTVDGMRRRLHEATTRLATPPQGVPVLQEPTVQMPVPVTSDSTIQISIPKSTLWKIGRRVLWFLLAGGGSVTLYEFVRYLYGRWH